MSARGSNRRTRVASLGGMEHTSHLRHVSMTVTTSSEGRQASSRGEGKGNHSGFASLFLQGTGTEGAPQGSSASAPATPQHGEGPARRKAVSGFTGSPKMRNRGSFTSSLPLSPSGAGAGNSERRDSGGSAKLLQSPRALTVQRVQPNPVLQSPTRSDKSYTFVPESGTRQLIVDGEYVLSKAPMRVESYKKLGGPSQRTVKDYQTLAFANQRAGRLRQEGQAYFNMGVLLDNQERHKSAISAYKKFLNISRRLGDVKAEALALNCLGVTCSNIKEQEYLQEAIEYHLEHGEISDDAGRYVAHTNLGLLYTELGVHEEAVRHFQFALQYAVKLNNMETESVCVCNLAQAAKRVGDLSMARICMERHVELCETLRAWDLRAAALLELGRIGNHEGELDEAESYLIEAMEEAKRLGLEGLLNEVRCTMGLVKAGISMQGVMSELGRSAKLRQDSDED